MNLNSPKYFLPYQLNWLNDNSNIKIWEKSHRIGATYVQSYEDVRDCLFGKFPAVWFSSADESAAREYIIYCEKWANLFQAASSDLSENVIDSKNDVKSLQIKFNNGSRINALTSNPKAFRSKGGKVILDEFAHHENQNELWKAAKPTAVWGFPIRIISTHNGKKSLFFKFTEKVKSNKLDWSLHNTTIYDAVKDGLVNKIYNKEVTENEKQKWIKQQQEDCFDEITWNEEFCCLPIDEATAFLSYQVIHNCRNSTIDLNSPLNSNTTYFCGFDIGRRKDLSVISLIESTNGKFVLRLLKIFENTPFSIQKDYLINLINSYNIVKTAIDESGLGMQLAEEMVNKFGNYKILPIYFTARIKEELAFNMLTVFQDNNILLPTDTELCEDLHSIRKTTSGQDSTHFEVDRSNIKGHADRFWSIALALFAAKNIINNDVIINSAKTNLTTKLLNKY
ncbi:MAG: terminase family protein [bacterium]